MWTLTRIEASGLTPRKRHFYPIEYIDKTHAHGDLTKKRFARAPRGVRSLPYKDSLPVPECLKLARPMPEALHDTGAILLPRF